jgi:tetratricopeptide (TPR) repeat protein
MVLLTSHLTEDLLRLCSRLGFQESQHVSFPSVYRTADGFLVRLPKPMSQAVPGAVRLRALAGNLLLPVDAELAPSLLPDEAFGLGKNRGLVFLPGGRLLEFQPQEPMALADLITVPKKAKRAWRSLPRPMPLSDRITEIELDLPLPPADELLESGGEDIGTDSARPEDSSPISKMAGNMTLGLGKALVGIGDLLHVRALSRLGANLIGGSLTWAPRLSEKLLGAQEAALRALLREFREGDSERALRRALPLTGHEARGGVPATNAQLPFHNLMYSLQKILGGRPGRMGFWFGGMDVHRELEREYRRQAELATRNGDYRRAAFIYAKLLGDYRLAAQVLERGGLHTDAAAIYLQKLQDSLAAARAYEAAGEFDRALELYRRRGDHEQAGELLQRIGEEEAALAEFETAARKLIESHHDYLRAGDLMMNKARRPDLGLRYFERGWEARPRGNPIPCALRIAKLYAGSDSPDRLLDLVSEAESYLVAAQADLAGQFYNGIAELADDPHLTGFREELRDRALMGIAAKMRHWAGESIAPGRIVSVLLGQSSAWSPPVVSDAAFAAKRESRRAIGSRPIQTISATTIIHGIQPIVTATCWASETGEVFLGFASGEIVSYRPLTGEVTPLPVGPFLGNLTIYGEPVSGSTLFRGDPVICLATDPKAELVVGLSGKKSADSIRLMSFVKRPNGGFVLRETRSVPTSGRPWLSPVVTHNGHHHVAMSDGEIIQLLSGASLAPLGRVEVFPKVHERYDVSLEAGLLLPRLENIGILLLGGGYGGFACPIKDFHDSGKRYRPFIRLGWTPGVPEKSSLESPVLACLQTRVGEVELAGITGEGSLYWSRLRLEDDGKYEVRTICTRWPQHNGYLAAAIIKSDLVVGVRKDRIEWLRCNWPGAGADEFTKRSETEIVFPTPVACYPHYGRQELVLISNEGTIGRVPIY